eukprot:2555219-Pleurochrysis_carterae.AAC.1
MAGLPPQSSFSSIARIGSRMQHARSGIELRRALTCPRENDDDIDRPSMRRQQVLAGTGHKAAVQARLPRRLGESKKHRYDKGRDQGRVE